MKQQSFSSLDCAHKKKRANREFFLGEMEAVVPWTRLEALISPHCTKPRKGRPQMPLSVMLRIYFLQQWYGLFDPGAEEALCDIHSMRDFAGLGFTRDSIPDQTTILNFRHLLEKHNLSEALFDAVRSCLEERALLLRGGTIMDATLIAASPPTRNETGKRNAGMSQSKKGNQWYFGMKAHIGVDASSGLAHTVKTTTGKVHDARLADDLIREDDEVIFGGKGYVSDKRKRSARQGGGLGGERQAQTRAGFVRFAKAAQQEIWDRAGQGRACFPSNQMPVRLSQGALPGAGQKRGAGVQPHGSGQPLSRAKMPDGGLCQKSGKSTQTATKAG